VVCVEIPPAVAVDLCRPVPIVDFMAPAPVVRATVPETAINEDGHTRWPENNVRFAPQPGQRRLMKAVAQPQCMQSLT
jgi:hypothetical protein